MEQRVGNASSPVPQGIRPVRPVEEVRAEARAASPPPTTGIFRTPDLVDLATLDPTLRFDLRYAGPDNFLSTQLYPIAAAYLQRPAAEALLRAHHQLAARGFGLLVFDAYRPWYVTKLFWEVVPPPQRVFVADPARGSAHNRGTAVDLTLCDRGSGDAVDMGSGFDEFSERALPDYPGCTPAQRRHRDLLRAVMADHGFSAHPVEWWHFDHVDGPHYPILNIPFEELRRVGR